MSLDKCKIIELPKITDPRGNLTFVESFKHIPFDIKRAYYLYDIPGGSERGGHAHKELKQLIIALSGSFEILLKEDKNEILYNLNSPSKGLYVCPMIWRELRNFSSGSVCLVLASNLFDEGDYYRDFTCYTNDLKNS